jgi:hypothetical protein
VIRPITSPYSYLVVMILNKEGNSHMYHDLQALNKFTIKEKFHIPVIDNILDDLHGANFFTKMDLRSWYHQI